MTSKETKNIPVENRTDDVSNEHFLVLHNDDFHTFDYVIDALIEICEHDYEQAAQCTFIVHHKGKCDVKKGGFSELKGMKNALIKKELNATIN
jgi:ATP-dependent Clp protease adaptor protein ClpS